MERPADRPRQLTMLGSFLASSLSACIACLFTNPMEVIKTRLQLDGEGGAPAARATATATTTTTTTTTAAAAAAAPPRRQYTGIWHALRTIARTEGARGLQAGLAGALAYQTAMNGVRLGLYEPVQRALVRATGADPASIALKATAAALSGALGATLGSPLYLIKSRLQAQRCARGERGRGEGTGRGRGGAPPNATHTRPLTPIPASLSCQTPPPPKSRAQAAPFLPCRSPTTTAAWWMACAGCTLQRACGGCSGG